MSHAIHHLNERRDRFALRTGRSTARRSIRVFYPLGAVLVVLLVARCAVTQPEETSTTDIAVRWELLSNFTDRRDVFEAQFTLVNHDDITLTDKNWALFFNMAPRPVVENKTPQPATLHHINGDWYKLVPNDGFRLEPGDSVNISYSGTEGVIKETDRPLGLYFVFYDEAGNEQRIAEVKHSTFVPFTREEQINRGPQDEEPIPTAAWIYERNLPLTELPPSDLKPIIPTPVRLTTSPGLLPLDDGFVISVQPDLTNEGNYLAARLEEVTGKTFTITSGDAGDSKVIRLETGDVTVDGKSDEAYRLSVSPEGIRITGSDAAGVFYGVQSLRALIPVEALREPSPRIALPFVEIEDAPRFGYRGLHMDVARNFQTKETVLRVLDLMSFYKLNRFLLYITEDEGWRLEIDGLPELTTVGAERRHTDGKESSALHPAYGSGPYPGGDKNYGTGYYTREDFIEILRYATARHIKVIPELNFPGHARAAIKAMEARYDRLMREGKEEEANEYRLIDPRDKSKYLSAQSFTDNVVSVARESTYRFYEKVVNEIAEMYAEAGLVLDEFHAGGDEVPEGAWTQSPMAAALMAEHPEITDPKNLQVYFFRELLKRLRKRNLRVDGWEEVALLKNAEGGYDPNPEFVGQHVVPFIWNNVFDFQDLGYRLANAGYSVVLCNVSNFYFDLAYSKDPREPGLYWAGFVNTRDAWYFAPFDMYKTTLTTSMGREIDPETEYADKVRLKPEARDNILGLEAQLWSETIKGRDMLEYYMLPKLIGFSESAWAQERIWETIDDAAKRAKVADRQWNIFANTLGQRELPRLSYLSDGYNYRVPPPGGVIRDGRLFANATFPGLIIRYTTDGSLPDENAPVYTAPVEVSGNVTLRSFDAAGKGSLVTRVPLTGLPRNTR